MYQNAPFSTQKSKYFLGRGTAPSPDPSQWGGETLSPHPISLGAFDALTLAPSALDHFPLLCFCSNSTPGLIYNCPPKKKNNQSCTLVCLFLYVVCTMPTVTRVAKCCMFQSFIRPTEVYRQTILSYVVYCTIRLRIVNVLINGSSVM